MKRQPLLVSFNGIQFDFVLMRTLLRREAEKSIVVADGPRQPREAELVELCDEFKALCSTSYDILAHIWQVDPERKFERGLNSLGAISVANGFGEKEMDGATAPRSWAQGRHAEVIEYCYNDVLKTQRLFEKIVLDGAIMRGDGQPIQLVPPTLAMREQVKGLNVRVLTHVQDPLNYMNAADLVVTMAGYNSLCQLFRLGKH